MSILVNHKVIGNLRLTPVLVQSVTALTGTGTATFSGTFATAPTQGNIIIAALGGIQLRAVTQPSGWVDVGVTYSGGGSGGTNHIGYKIAGPSEGTTYNFTFGASLSGGGSLYEFSFVDTASPVGFHGGFKDVVSVTSVQPIPGGFNIPYPGVGISTVQVGSGTGASWNPDNGYSRAVNGEFVRARKIYTQAETGANITWTGSSTGAGSFMVFFKGRLTT